MSRVLRTPARTHAHVRERSDTRLICMRQHKSKDQHTSAYDEYGCGNANKKDDKYACYRLIRRERERRERRERERRERERRERGGRERGERERGAASAAALAVSTKAQQEARSQLICVAEAVHGRSK